MKYKGIEIESEKAERLRQQIINDIMICFQHSPIKDRITKDIIEFLDKLDDFSYMSFVRLILIYAYKQGQCDLMDQTVNKLNRKIEELDKKNPEKNK